MTELLARLFVKNSEDIKNSTVRHAYGIMASIVGIVANLLLFVGKLTVGMVSGALSIMADAFNNLSDAGSQIVSLVSFKIASKPADRDHPFGHARIEYVASMIVSFLVLLVGFELFTESISKLIAPVPPSREKWAVTVGVLLASIAVKLWLGIFNRKLAKKIDSSVMRATSADSFSDAVSTTVVLLGMGLYFVFGWDRVDAIMGLCVAVMIFIAGLKILNETKNSILGERPSDEVVEGITRIVGEFPEALGIHDLVVHNYGVGCVFASIHIEVDGKRDIYETHDVIDNIEKRLESELSIEATVHMDPIVTDDATVDHLRDIARRAVAVIDDRFKIHDFRCVVGQSHTNLIFDVVVPFEVKLTDDEICHKIAEAVRLADENFNTVVTVDRA